MKIIGKYKDYYDGGSKYGYDEQVVFVRNINLSLFFDKNKVNLERVHLPSNYTNNKRDNHYIDYEPFIIWFCGKTYLTYKFQEYTKIQEWFYPEYNIKTYFLYGDEMVKKIKSLHKTGNKYFVGYFDDLEKNSFKIENAYELAKEYKTPYFVISNFKNDYHSQTAEIEMTPRLSDFQFYNVVDMIQAYQQIEMFLPQFNVDPISEMTDEQKIHSHGLDETSFRCQAPGNKKERRKLNKLKKKNKKEH